MPATLTDTTQRALEALIPDGEIHELAIARVGRKGLESSFYETRTELLAHLPSDDDESVEAVYFTPNPVDKGHFDLGEPPTRGSRTKDEHVSTRAWFFLDFDPDRPTRTSATDEEKAKARALLDETVAFLSARGFPKPLVIDSGNGFHVYYKVTPEAGDKVRPLTRALSVHKWHADGAKVDPKVHNPARLMKFPGTMTRKGVPSDDRPHRPSAVLESDEIVPVDLAMFNVVLSALQPEAPSQRAESTKEAEDHTTCKRGLTIGEAQALVSGGSDLKSWLEEHVGEGNYREEPDLNDGGPASRVYRCRECPLKKDREKADHSAPWKCMVGEIIKSAKGGVGARWASCKACANSDAYNVMTRLERWHCVREHYEEGYLARPCAHLLKRLRDIEKKRDRQKEWAAILRDKQLHTQLARIAEREPTEWEATLTDLRALDGIRLEDVKALVKLVGAAEPDEPGGTSPATVARQIDQQTPVRCIHKELHVYEGGVYRGDSEVLIRNRVQEIRGDAARKHQGEEVVYWMKNAYFVRDDEIDVGDLINVKNGLLDWRTGELQPHDPGHLSTVQLAASWKSNAYHARLDKFLDEVLPDSETRGVFEEAMGYCLLRDCRFRKAFLLTGNRRGGKSKTLAALEAMLGPDNVAAIPLKDFGGDRFAGSGLVGKTANIVADIDSGAVKDTGVFKAIVSGDSIQVEQKNKPSFRYKVRAKLWYSANDLPPPKDLSDAFFDRFVIFPFLEEFVGKKADARLEEKLTTSDALSYLLLLAVEGLRRLDERGYFKDTDATLEAVEQYRQESDPVTAFVKECCEIDPEASVSKAALYMRFQRFYLAQGFHGQAPTNTVFSKRLKRGVPDLGDMKARTAGGRESTWLGIGLEFSTGSGLGNRNHRFTPWRPLGRCPLGGIPNGL